VATATLRADAAERQAQRTAEALEASQAALTAAETAAAALRLEVATLTERAAQNADLRAVIATLQASERGQAGQPANQAQDEILDPTTAAPAKVADAPQLKFELQQPDPAPTEAAPKKPAARRRTPPPPVV